ncbi:glycosyl hydrolase family 16 [Pseudonocardia hierapolitana]|uniref:Glycosyl hydrolase family 16 n=1 Tax=Pseudonocardia hierapolitana TaxID=1128676 RepID=A0A561SR53_9PSEU|nr:glycosyl hydrolase family 16 [Pseudonocardia hierapolitana]
MGGRSGSATELIGRVTAERGSDDVAGTGWHRLPPGHAEAVVTRDADRTNSMTRRLAPLAVGAVVMLVATLVATLAQPPEDPSLAAQELSNTVTRTDPAQAPPPPPEPTPEPTAEPQAAAETTEPTQPLATRKPETAERKSTGGGQAAAAPRKSEGRSAAAAKGWTRAGGDEFNGGLSPLWSPYDSEGHAGNGRRTPDAVSVENGMLVIRGDSEGNTGGMSWKEDQRFGRWEMRARFPKGDDQYHPVLILWRESGGKENGEIDFAETTSASPDVSFFLHYGSEQEYAKKTLDITQWHNYAVEWVDGRVTGYIDGEKWFESTDEKTLPPGKMHATIQLDYFPEGGSPKPTEMHVDYMRIYR